MGMDASAALSFGMEFEEGYEFPWGDDEIDEWWRKEIGFKSSKEIYDENWNYLPGVTKEEKDFHWKERQDFDKTNPCPVAEVKCGSYDGCYNVILSAREPIIGGSWDNAREFDPTNDFVIPTDILTKYNEFMNKYFPNEFTGGKWLMTCLWG
jgi:hypothetical protein